MIPWVLIDTVTVPGGGGILKLRQRGTEWSITLDGADLMNNRLSGSEEALATLTCEKLATGRSATRAPHLLIGGLGMGFTLRAALSATAAEARMTVVELVPAVVDWARGPMAELFAGCLEDARVQVHVADVGAEIAGAPGRFDAILLDVDNGPEGLTRIANDRLYNGPGLRAAHAALRPGGVLSVWSAVPDRAFGRRLERHGFEVDERTVRAGRGRGARHTIWLATAVAAPKA
jgi:spermidine synthase